MAARLLSRRIQPLVNSTFLSIGIRPVQSSRNFFQRNNNLPDLFFGTASNFFRDLEKEFERMHRQFDRLRESQYRHGHRQGQRELSGFKSSTNNDTDLIVTESDGSRKFHLSFDIHGFEPEEIKIKTENRTLTISAKKEKKNNDGYSLHEFTQSYTLPKDLKVEDLKSTYSEDGFLKIEAPLPKGQPKERHIPIDHGK